MNFHYRQLLVLAMAEFPAMPLFTDAYLGDTRHLSTIEHGAYLLLLIVAWRNDGTLPNDDRLLARYTGLTGRQWLRMKPTILEFFTVETGSIFQPRLRDELNLVRRKRDSAAANGRASALKRQERHSAKRQRSVNGASTPKPKPLLRDSPNGESTPFPPQPEWQHFAEYRKGVGKPLTPHAVKLNLAKLERLSSEGHDPRAVLNQSIERGWTGLFEVKEDYHYGRNEHPGGKTGAAAASLLAELEDDQRGAVAGSNVVALPGPSRPRD